MADDFDISNYQRLVDEIEDLRRYLEIDLTNLHQEAKELPLLIERAGRVLGEFRYLARRAKIQREVVEAKAEREIRAKPEDYGIAKTTESAISAAKDVRIDVVNSREDLASMEYYSALADAIYQAFLAKREMLKLEVELYFSNYYGAIEIKDKHRLAEEEVINVRRKRKDREDS